MHNRNCFSVPNFNVENAQFDRQKYWRGPVWININWLLMHGLRRYGFHEKAESVRQDIIELVRRFGFYEYFDPFEGTGYGSNSFSWTAALFLDCVLENEQPTAI
jgi:glycogen debranching enzyme